MNEAIIVDDKVMCPVCYKMGKTTPLAKIYEIGEFRPQVVHYEVQFMCKSCKKNHEEDYFVVLEI